MTIEFVPFPKIPRLKRAVTITEKIDGTNACVVITEDGEIGAQSRNRVITPDNDNFDFAAWVHANAEDLRQLGPGYHYGEYYGRGIGRNYGLEERRFALFNTARWNPENPNRPKCCDVVPVLCQGGIDAVDSALHWLREAGSIAVPGFMKPEGIIVYHSASRGYYKVLLENDELPKGIAA